ncbi:MAG: RHS repeat-associated core domain-containing protein, partial [Deltaproteobacteria bacterium]
EFMRTKFEYDLLGREAAVHQSNGMRSEATYDGRGRLVEERSCRTSGLAGHCGNAAESRAVFSRNGVGQLVAITGSGGLALSFTYDSLGRLSSTMDQRSGPDDISVVGYDARNRIDLRSFALSDGVDLGTVLIQYDNNDRAIEIDYVRDGSVESLVSNVFSAGQLLRQTFGDRQPIVRAYSYEYGRLKNTATTREVAAAADVPASLAAVASVTPENWIPTSVWSGGMNRGNTTSVEIDGGGTTSWESWSFWSDNASRRLKHYYSDHPTGSGGQYFATYDALSNVESFWEPEWQRRRLLTYDASHTRLLRIESVDDGSVLEYQYDPGGFVTRRGNAVFAWTATGALAAYGRSGASSGTVEFAYDGLGRPTQRSVSGVPAWTRRFRFGGVVEEDASGQRRLDLGFVVVEAGGAGRLFRHLDRRGNVKFITDESGQATTHYHYDAYGLTDVDGDATADIERRFANGLDLGEVTVLGARVLDPLAARFLSPDPAYNMVNQYSYTLGNPVELQDPGGELAIITAAAVVTVVAGSVGIVVGSFQMYRDFTGREFRDDLGGFLAEQRGDSAAKSSSCRGGSCRDGAGSRSQAIGSGAIMPIPMSMVVPGGPMGPIRLPHFRGGPGIDLPGTRGTPFFRILPAPPPPRIDGIHDELQIVY